MERALWSQERFALRCEWGPTGATRLASPGCALVVVDVLSFTTAVTVAVDRGTAVHPVAWRNSRAAETARNHGAALAVGRREVTEENPWSLSPAALRRAPAPERLVLPSPNGSAIAAAASGVVVAASLRNAAAVGAWLHARGYGTPDLPVSVIPSGERWRDGSLRPAIEDLLGAGAVLAALSGYAPSGSPSPEATVARSLFEGLNADAVKQLVRASASGEELSEGGFGEDVEVAVEMDTSDVVPVLDNGWFVSVGVT
jgi:2-phosphosulfolactate phosphatase